MGVPLTSGWRVGLVLSSRKCGYGSRFVACAKQQRVGQETTLGAKDRVQGRGYSCSLSESEIPEVVMQAGGWLFRLSSPCSLCRC